MIGTSIIWRGTIDRKFSWREASGQVTGNKLRQFYSKCHRSLNGFSFSLKIFLKINMRIWIFQTIIRKFLLFSTFFLKKNLIFYWNQALYHKFNCVGMSYWGLYIFICTLLKQKLNNAKECAPNFCYE